LTLQQIADQITLLQRELDLVRSFERAGDLNLISETVLSATAASVTFSSIPGTFRNLLLVLQVRTDRVAENDAWLMRFNSDSGSNYDYNTAQVNNDAITGITLRAQTFLAGGNCEAANSRASSFYPSVITIPGYENTNSEKWALIQDGAFGDVSADSDMFSSWRHGRWRNTDAVTSIAFLPNIGPNFVANSIFTLYGIL
jgi:hypothetical protein